MEQQYSICFAAKYLPGIYSINIPEKRWRKFFDTYHAMVQARERYSKIKNTETCPMTEIVIIMDDFSNFNQVADELRDYIAEKVATAIDCQPKPYVDDLDFVTLLYTEEGEEESDKALQEGRLYNFENAFDFNKIYPFPSDSSENFTDFLSHCPPNWPVTFKRNLWLNDGCIGLSDKRVTIYINGMD